MQPLLDRDSVDVEAFTNEDDLVSNVDHLLDSLKKVFIVV